MYITVTMKEVDELVECGVDILAVQGTGACARTAPPPPSSSAPSRQSIPTSW